MANMARLFLFNILYLSCFSARAGFRSGSAHKGLQKCRSGGVASADWGNRRSESSTDPCKDHGNVAGSKRGKDYPVAK